MRGNERNFADFRHGKCVSLRENLHKIPRYSAHPFTREWWTLSTKYFVCYLQWLAKTHKETKPEVNIFKDPIFRGFQRTLDSEIKRLRTPGMGVKKKQAEPITIEEEDMFWEKGFFGESNPKSLLDTMLYRSFCIKKWWRTLQSSFLSIWASSGQPLYAKSEKGSGQMLL